MISAKEAGFCIRVHGQKSFMLAELCSTTFGGIRLRQLIHDLLNQCKSQSPGRPLDDRIV